jgi:tetratricopeptide (TPR) repeat protein
VRGVLAALDERFLLLTAGRRTVLARHRTLRATVDWSYHLLSEPEQQVFRRLSIFASSFDIDAARMIAVRDSEDRWASINLLSGLVDKSLLTLDLGQAVPRYRFLESLRFYAFEKLAESGDVAVTAQRHATYVADRVRRASEDWKVLSTDDWSDAYEDMAEDLRASLDWAISEGGDARTGLDILVHAPPFWMLLSLHDECRRRTIQVLNDSSKRVTLEPADEMRLHAALGTALSWATGPVKETRVAWEKALELAERLSATEFELQAQYGLWLYSLRSGGYAAALEHASEMMRLAAAADDHEAQAVGRRIAGVAHHFLGRHAQARELIEDSVRWHELNRPPQAFRFGLDQRVAALAFLSRVLWVQGHSDRAKQTAATAVADARALDHANTLCCALAEGWCAVYALEDDLEAVKLETKALKDTATAHGLGFWRTYCDLFECWARMHEETDVSASDVDALVATVEDLEFDPGYSILLSDILVAAHRKGATTPALSRLISSLPSQSTFKAPWAEPEFRRIGARIAATSDLAVQALRDALAVSERQQAWAWTLRITLDLADRLEAQANSYEGASLLAAALDVLPDGNHSPEATAARAMAARLTGKA